MDALGTTVDIAVGSNAAPVTIPARRKKPRNALWGYSLLLAVLCAGWLLKDKQLINPEHGLGYWLGISGGSMMLILLLYPASKRSRLLRRLGLVRHWFRIHMMLGLLGPSFILFHCNFSVDALNSRVALYSMLGVAASGIIGRYFYARIHRGLYGKRASVEELRNEIIEASDDNRGLAAILPGFVHQLQTTAADLLGDQLTRSISLKQSLSWTVKYYVVRIRLHRTIRSELQAHASQSSTVQTNLRNLRRTANAYAAHQASSMRQLAQFAFYERLFSLWHVFHMPLFLLLVISALVHVLAVHMY